MSYSDNVMVVEPELYGMLKTYRKEICFRVPLLHYLLYKNLSEEGKAKVKNAVSEAFVKAVEELTETTQGTHITVKEKRAGSNA